MQKRNCLKTSLMCAALCLSLTVATLPVNGQSPSASSPKTQTVSVSEELLIAMDAAFVELEGLRKIKKLSDEQLAEYATKVGLLEQIVAKQEAALNASGEASTKLTAAVSEARTVIADYKTELDRVRLQRDKAKKRLFVLSGIALLAGVVIGAVFSNR